MYVNTNKCENTNVMFCIRTYNTHYGFCSTGWGYFDGCAVAGLIYRLKILLPNELSTGMVSVKLDKPTWLIVCNNRTMI